MSFQYNSLIINHQNSKAFLEQSQNSRCFGREIQNLPQQNKSPSLKDKPYSIRTLETYRMLDTGSSQRQSESTIDEEIMFDIGQLILEEYTSRPLPDPQFVTPYAEDIFQYLDENEIKFIAPPSYMDNFQQEINPRMRQMLVDWLVEVHRKFKLVPETLYLTVNLIDRYLSQNKVKKSQLQLVGVAALFIASKYEEIYAPELKDFVNICDKAYTKFDILRMEGSILQDIQFTLTYISPLKFLERYTILIHQEESHQVFQTSQYHLAQYILELALNDYYSLQFHPSLQAASAIYLAQKLIGLPMNVPSIYNEQSLFSCAKHLFYLRQGAEKGQFVAVFRKYSNEDYLQVSQIPLPI